MDPFLAPFASALISHRDKTAAQKTNGPERNASLLICLQTTTKLDTSSYYSQLEKQLTCAQKINI